MSNITLVFLFVLIDLSFTLNLLDICQSGIRDDGITYVHCARKSLKDIPRFSSNRLFNLAFDELILSDNLIKHIPQHAFHGLRIKRLIMSGNQLKSIHRNAFEEIENYLEELVLEFDSTVVDTIPQALQTNLANIKSLTLINLNLRSLSSSSNLFHSMKKLEYLSLKSCFLQSIDSNLFETIEKQLRTLILDSNQLNEQIFPEINRLISLEKLSLAHNQIEQFDLQWLNQRLQHLDLSYNQIKRIHFIRHEQLQILNLQNNRLTSESLTGSISSQLKVLNFDFNSVQKFPEEFFPMENSLEILSLENNDFLLTNSDNFQYLNRLKKLNLARNNIQIIPKSIDRFHNQSNSNVVFFSDLFRSTWLLEDLNMDRNPLFPLSNRTFSGLENSLQNLSLQSCSLTSQSLISILHLTNLQRLKLQSNYLTSIVPENLFSSMNKLIGIDLQRNQLTRIPSEYPSNLRELQLANNRLTNLPFTNELFEELSQLNVFDISFNPLECDCRMKSIYRWLVTHYQRELIPHVQWICAQPKEFSGKQLGLLEENQLICQENSSRIVSFDIWTQDSNSILLEWSLTSNDTPLTLLILENHQQTKVIELNQTENYHLLTNLKSSTNYSLCLQIIEQNLCRNLTTKDQQALSIVPFEFIFRIEYILIGIALIIILIFLIICLVICHFNRQYRKSSHSSNTTTTIDSYYQTTGSDMTQFGICSHSLEEQSMPTYHQQTLPIVCYCQLPKSYSYEQQSLHLYHEIPSYKTPIRI